MTTIRNLLASVLIAASFAAPAVVHAGSDTLTTCASLVDLSQSFANGKAKGMSKEVMLAMTETGLKGESEERVAFVKQVVENVWSNKYKSVADRNNQVMLGCLKVF